MALDAEQRGVARGMAIGAVASAAVLGIGLIAPPLALPLGDAMADRIAFALRADLVLGLWLLASVGAVAKGRFFSPRDISGAAYSDPTPRIAVARAVLQNTHEQVTLAVTVHLALATLLPAGQMGAIPLLVILFSIGRLAFWLGYAGGATSRSIGFAMTFYPTIFGALWAAWLIVFGA
jgi:hypothetical protein